MPERSTGGIKVKKGKQFILAYKGRNIRLSTHVNWHLKKYNKINIEVHFETENTANKRRKR